MYKSDARCKKVNVRKAAYALLETPCNKAPTGCKKVNVRKPLTGLYTKRSAVNYTKFLIRSYITQSYIMKKILILLLALLPLVAIQAKPNKQTVVLYCDLHCQGCCDKIMKNIAFEKGVKDIQFDMEQQAVTVTYDADKTDVPTLQKAFAKIGKPATTRKPEPADHDHDHDHEHQGHKHSK